MASDLLGIAVSGLKASQAQLTVTGHNITNANQEGYTRQTVDLATNPAQFQGFGYVGNGVSVQSVDRVVNEFLVAQIRLDSSAFNQVDAFSSKISEIDSLLASDSISLATGFSSFFSSLQAATDDPTSIPVRQLVLAEAEVLSQRFTSLYGRLDDANDIINQELEAQANQITALAQSLAEINEQIVNAAGQGNGVPPNDLLDQRDETMLQLSELISVSSFEQSDGAVNIFVGNGQPLVIGSTASVVEAQSGQSDPQRLDIVFVTEGNSQIVTDKMTGGRIGGLLDFREEVLDRSLNELGRIALTFTDAMNQQQSIGLDLNGNYGVNLFEPINNDVARQQRVVSAATNLPPIDRTVTVDITDPGNLSNSDYELKLSGAGPDRYDLVRLSDDVVVQSGGLSAARPFTISYDSFDINLEEGTFQDGDSFRIMPTRFAAGDIEVIATTPEVLAFAQPISTGTSLSNTGTGDISQGEVISTTDPTTGELLSTFASLGELSPPLVVIFTSPTTYDVLDATDPNNPVSLVPPLENQPFIPGETNDILPTEPGQTLVVADGFNAGRIPRATEIVTGAIGTEADNTYQPEDLTVSYTDPVTGLVSTQPLLQFSRGDSAEELARELSSRDGVTATAFTQTQIRIVDDASVGPALDFKLHLNGVDLLTDYATFIAPTTLPSPLSNDDIAEAININGALQQQGISAVSDGDTITITARSGADLRFQVEGDAGTDFIQIKGDDTPEALTTVDVSAGADLNTGGPNSFTIDVFDGPGNISNPKVIDISGVYGSGDTLVTYLQGEIDQAYGISGKITVSLRDDGTLSFQSSDSSPLTRIQVSGVGAADPLGLSAAEMNGITTTTDIVTVDGTGVAGTVNASTVGGTVTVVLEENFSLSSSAVSAGNMFTPEPEANDYFIGYTFAIAGNPDTGDEFFVNFNEDGISDNRNALKFVELEAAKLIGGNSSIQEAYGDLVEFVGTTSAGAQINQAAADEILYQSKELRSSISGVNLDEEAANLIRFEVIYNASSRVISVARDLFDTLLQAF